MNYTDRIKSLREDKDLTQEKIAKLLNIGQKTYSDYERGKIRIPIDSIIVLAEYYDVSIDYICGVTNIKNRFPKI